jgi:hypothetical protein
MQLQKGFVFFFAIIVLSGCTLGNVSPNNEIILETLVANAVLTAAADATKNATLTIEVLPTDTLMPPTEVPTLAPSPTPTEVTIPDRFIDDPGGRWGPPKVSHTFDEDVGWTTYPAEYTSLTIEDGVLKYLTRDADNTPSWSFSYLTVQDVYIEFLTRNPVECSGNDRYGLVLRSPNYDDGYFLGFNCLGQYSFTKFENAFNEVLIPWTSTDLIDMNPTAYNRIAILMDDDLLVVHINGVDVNAVRDSAFFGGYLGVWVASENTPNFAPTFEEINIWLVE